MQPAPGDFYPGQYSPDSRRAPGRRRTVVIIASLAAVVVLAVAAWVGTSILHNRISPSGAPQLALLRQLPHPAGAAEISHRTQRGQYNSTGTAWLTYQISGAACPAVLTTLAEHGIRQLGAQPADPVKAHCAPSGNGFATFCVPKVFCFLADFTVDHNPTEYTLSTGPNGSG